MKDTGGTYIKSDQIWFVEGDTIYYMCLEDWFYEEYFLYMLDIYDIQFESPEYSGTYDHGHTTIKIIHNCNSIKIELFWVNRNIWLNDIRVHNMAQLFLELLTDPLNFINKIRKNIDPNGSQDTRDFIDLLEENIIQKHNTPFQIYLMLRIMAYDNIIVGDVVDTIIKLYINIVCSMAKW